MGLVPSPPIRLTRSLRKDRGARGAVGKVGEQGSDEDPRSLDHGVPAADFGVRYDAVMVIHESSPASWVVQTGSWAGCLGSEGATVVPNPLGQSLS